MVYARHTEYISMAYIEYISYKCSVCTIAPRVSQSRLTRITSHQYCHIFIEEIYQIIQPHYTIPPIITPCTLIFNITKRLIAHLRSLPSERCFFSSLSTFNNHNTQIHPISSPTSLYIPLSCNCPNTLIRCTHVKGDP